ncbi:hypothetical protein [Leadbetterella byssophila]|uniref:hypothetical protein n=1 Tax=Leadbetterella byssophila TaxID=316068 RepID=UPI0039A175E5
MSKKVFVIIAVCVIALLWWYQYSITVNVPWWDDFHGIILPVHDLFTDLPLGEKLHSFFSLNNEHRVVNDRIFTLLVFLISGKFELKTVALLGFINLIGILWVVISVARRRAIKWEALLPMVFLIFHAQYYESLQSLMVPFQNFSVIFYFLVSIYLISIKRNYIWGFVFATLAFFSHGNGILALLIGGALLFVHQDYKALGIWIGASVLTVALYFWGYTKPNWTHTDVISPWEHPLQAIAYSLEFLGAYALNIVEISSRLSNSPLKQKLPQFFGLVIVLFSLLILFRKYALRRILSQLRTEPTDQFFLAMAAFFLGTGIMMGLTRTGFPVLSRYTINSSLLLVAIWGYYATNYRGHGRKLWLGFTILIWLLSYYNATERAFYNRENALADAYNYQKTGTWANQYSDSAHVSRVNPLLIAPWQEGEYQFPKETDLSALAGSNGTRIDNWDEVNGHLMVHGESAEVPYFALRSEDYTFIFPGKRLRNSPLEIIKGKGYFSHQFSTAFPLEVIPSRNYQLFRIK